MLLEKTEDKAQRTENPTVNSASFVLCPLFFVLYFLCWLQFLTLSSVLQDSPALLHIVFGLEHQLLCPTGIALLEHAVACLVIRILLERNARRLRVEDERLDAAFGQHGVVAVERPVARL